MRPSEVTPTQQEVWSGRLSAYTTCNTFSMRGLFDYLLRHYPRSARRFSRDVVHLHLRRAMVPAGVGGAATATTAAAWAAAGVATNGGGGNGSSHGGSNGGAGFSQPAAGMQAAAAPVVSPGGPLPLTTAESPLSDGPGSGSATVGPPPRTELPGFVNALVSNFFPTESSGSGIADGLFPNVVPVPSSPDDDEWVASEAGPLPLSYALEPSGVSSGAADLTASLASAVNDTLAGVGDVFVFSYGVIVSWGLSENAEEAIIAQMRSFEIGSLEGGAENEIFDYGYWGGGDALGGGGGAPPGVHTDVHVPAAAAAASASAAASAVGGDGAHGPRAADVDASCVRIAQDTVLLSLGLSPDNLVRAKLAVSHAVAQSSKLASFESAVEGVFDRISHLPVALAQTGRLNISDRELLRLSGELYTYRAYINLQVRLAYQWGWVGVWVTSLALSFSGAAVLSALCGRCVSGPGRGCDGWAVTLSANMVELALLRCRLFVFRSPCWGSARSCRRTSWIPLTFFGTMRNWSRSTTRARATWTFQGARLSSTKGLTS